MNAQPDIFEQIKSMLNATPYDPQKDDNVAYENKAHVKEAKDVPKKNVFEQLSKFAEKLDSRNEQILKVSARAIRYLLEMNKELANELSELRKEAEAREFAKQMYDRGLIEFKDIDKYANKIKEDIPSWKKAIDLMGISSFGGNLMRFGEPSNKVDPLYKILQEVGYGEV